MDLDDVKQIPILDVAARLGIAVRHGKSARCPFPGHVDVNPSFYLYVGTNSCWCHGCGRGGDAINLVAISQGWAAGDSIRWLRETYNLSSSRSGGRISRNVVRKIAPVSRTQVAETPTFGPNAEIYETLLAEYPMGKEAAAYLKLRGFSETTISHFRLGFLTDAESASRRLIKCFGRESVYRAGLLSNIGERATFMLPNPSVLFPFIENGKIAYIQSRLLPGAKGKRWMGPRGVAKPVYNADVITKSQTVYICEGATDVVSAHELNLAAIGILGGRSRLPENVLSALKGRTVYIVPDADDAGSRIAAKLRENLRSRGIRSITKPLSMGKDINEFLLLSRRRR